MQQKIGYKRKDITDNLLLLQLLLVPLQLLILLLLQ